jgi:dipicolinate synthase subunit A
MRVLICGNGTREKCLAELCQSRGHLLPDHGPWDVAVLPLPKSYLPEDRTDQLPRGQKIVCGMTAADFDRLAEKRGWNLLRVLKDEAYTLENAALTAEGALFTAVARMNRALRGSQCLVIGYGRIGKALTGLLRAMGAKVTVAARREESRREAGENSLSIEEMPQALPRMDVIFNTVPAPVLEEKELRRVKPQCVMIDLASAPYGIDRDAAEALGLRAFLESGLPGRYCPVSAAETLLSYMEAAAGKK